MTVSEDHKRMMGSGTRSDQNDQIQDFSDVSLACDLVSIRLDKYLILTAIAERQD